MDRERFEFGVFLFAFLSSGRIFSFLSSFAFGLFLMALDWSFVLSSFHGIGIYWIFQFVDFGRTGVVVRYF
jgi:hypothetical protein